MFKESFCRISLHRQDSRLVPLVTQLLCVCQHLLRTSRKVVDEEDTHKTSREEDELGNEKTNRPSNIMASIKFPFRGGETILRGGVQYVSLHSRETISKKTNNQQSGLFRYEIRSLDDDQSSAAAAD